MLAKRFFHSKLGNAITRRPSILPRLLISYVSSPTSIRTDSAEQFVSVVTGLQPEQVHDYVRDLESHESFSEHLSRGLSIIPATTKVQTDQGLVTPGYLSDHGTGKAGLALYVLVRFLRPDHAVETGVCNGESSAYILRALEDNQHGTLISIDLPALRGYYCEDGLSYYVPDDREIGWLVPEQLRRRWQVVFGRSTEKLAPLVEELGHIDFFLHDSLHTYDNMTFEYNVAWKYLRPSGMLLTDDVGIAFRAFAHMKSVPYFVFGSIGAIRKPSVHARG